ncbi:MAG: hypothetical protein R3321_00205 [Nitrososphaeraceae archaeon]|nr:hypothetical protein [Nitrososphaeraceae archaeon]
MVYGKFQKQGYHYQLLGELKRNYDSIKFTSYIERVLLANSYDLLIIPQDLWKIDAIRAFTNEQFTLIDLQYLTEYENMYFRNLPFIKQHHILKSWFREIRGD